MCAVHKAALALVLIGALNWGLIGLFKLNLVMYLFVGWRPGERVVYVLVGLAAVTLMSMGRCCMKGCACGDDGCGHCDASQKKPEAASGAKM